MVMSIGVRNKKPVVNQPPPWINQEEIAKLAYQLFERRGGVGGFDQQDWFEAERIICQRRRNS